jgi:hypothetical protein
MNNDEMILTEKMSPKYNFTNYCNTIIWLKSYDSFKTKTELVLHNIDNALTTGKSPSRDFPSGRLKHHAKK